MEQITIAIVAFVLGIVTMIGICAGAFTDNANRALACMDAGNTVAQCQTILGITHPH